jgi:mono/diheme cytochrome c family protein
MPISVSAVLGVVFLALAFVSTFMMFKFWGYPYDKERRKSECPQWKMNIHRGVGYAYGIIYLVMMAQMVPRLWEYQVEFPARTVAHIMLGFTIGVILILKISILRWFRHFEEWMPVLGVALLTCTVLLSGLSLPFVFREQVLASSEETFSEPNRARVKALLASAGLSGDADLESLSSESGLRRGRRVLLEECTFCHDLKTAIARPRTPEDWVHTVARMAEKPTVGPRIDEAESQAVTAYLVAITPELQQSAKAKRAEDQMKEEALEAVNEMEIEPTDAVKEVAPAPSEPDAPSPPAPAPRAVKPAPDPAAARRVFQAACAKCHELSDVDKEPPRSNRQVSALIRRMVDNGMEESRKDLELIRWHLIETYVKKKK